MDPKLTILISLLYSIMSSFNCFLFNFLYTALLPNTLFLYILVIFFVTLVLIIKLIFLIENRNQFFFIVLSLQAISLLNRVLDTVLYNFFVLLFLYVKDILASSICTSLSSLVVPKFLNKYFKF